MILVEKDAVNVECCRVMFDSITSKEYMEFATPISACCVKDGIPLIPFFKGKNIMSWGCGHCGLVVCINNSRLADLPKTQEGDSVV